MKTLISVKKDLKTFDDYVKYYNDLDAIGLVEGMVKMQKVYRDQGLDMFKDAVSLPRLAQKEIFRSLNEDYFTTFSEKHSHIFKELRNGIVGGPSIVFTRYMLQLRRFNKKNKPGTSSSGSVPGC